MTRGQLTKAPTWPNASLPTPDVLQRGYSESWFYACKDSGVGEYAPGKFFQPNSGKRIRSVVRDIEREVVAGRQPVLPIPHDTVYEALTHISTWPSQSTMGLQGTAEEKDSTVEVRRLKEISSNEVQPCDIPLPKESSTGIENRKRKDAELMPPPAAARRPATFRSVRGPRSKGLEEESYRSPLEQPSSQRASEAAPTLTLSTAHPECADAALPSKRSVDASLARRPRTMRKNLSTREPLPMDAATSSSENVKPTLPTRSVRSRARVAPPEVVEVYDEAPEPMHRPTMTAPPPIQAEVATPKAVFGSPSTFPGTHPADVLDRLCIFRDNLAAAVEKKRLAPRRGQAELKEPLPFVNRWVDYSRKYGVGYVLEDGTVGYIANADPSRGTPVTHVAVRNGENWLRRAGKRFENLEQVPFQILEDCGQAGVRRLSTSPTQDQDRERLRMLKVLWVKFGRYMAPNVHDSESDVPEISEQEESTGDLLFVRFYQRLGNVGIWGFSDGCIQVSFVNKAVDGDE